MSAIGPGDWVECKPPAGYRGQISRSAVRVTGEYPVVGRIYCVRQVGTYRDQTGGLEDGLRLMGIVASIPGHPDAWWPARCFRPIYRPKQSLIESLQHPAPADEQFAHEVLAALDRAKLSPPAIALDRLVASIAPLRRKRA